jgi:calcineurin-like phosphoesterase family protein
MNLQNLYDQSRETARHRIWVFSDLQQYDPALAEECLTLALDDMQTVGIDVTHLWYLGDATEGRDPEHTRRMTDLQVERLGGLNIPLRFVMGNHDLDATRNLSPGTTPVLPAYDAFRQVPGWRTTKTPQDPAFTETLGDALVVFLSDHVSPENRWFATQQEIRGEVPGDYPHDLAVYRDLRQRMADWDGPVILAGHYAFPGGARGTPQGGPLEGLLPLPENVKLILHGHSHIGDWLWGKKDAHQRLSWVDWHEVPQANISSLDRRRGSQTRSAVLHLQPDGTLALFFRDHEDGRWSDAFFTDTAAPRSHSDLSIQTHAEKKSLEGTDFDRWQQQSR